jgi:hypothetical protein
MTARLIQELQEAMRAHTRNVEMPPDVARRAFQTAWWRRRFRRGVTVSAAVGSMAVAVTLITMGLVLPEPQQGANVMSVAVLIHRMSPTPQQLRSAVIAAYLPASGEDLTFDATRGLGAFRRAVADHEVARCMARRNAGYSPTDPWVDASHLHVMDFPDPSLLGRYGLEGPGIQSKPDDADLAACEASVALPAVLAPGADPTAALWMRTAEAVNQDPRVLSAYRTFGPCVQKQGIPVDSEDEFFSYADEALQAVNSDPQRQTLDVHLGGVYAQCIKPVERVRARIRGERRDAFLADHPRWFADLLTKVAEAVSGVQRRIPLAWPA